MKGKKFQLTLSKLVVGPIFSGLSLMKTIINIWRCHNYFYCQKHSEIRRQHFEEDPQIAVYSRRMVTIMAYAGTLINDLINLNCSVSILFSDECRSYIQPVIALHALHRQI